MMQCIKTILLAVMAFVTAAGAAAETQRGRLLADGHLVAGIEGRVVSDPNNTRWLFFPASTETDEAAALPAGSGAALLPCSVLEQMAQLAGAEGELDVRLWAMATRYEGRNYLYSLYFLPVRAAAREVPEPDETETDEKPAPQRESVLPSEILEMMDRTRAPDLRRLDKLVEVSTDRNLIHRTGLITPTDDGFVFTPDGLGRNVDQRTYDLLPNRALETTQRTMQQFSGVRQRYVVSGVLTEFEGQTYFLLRRAVRSFSHGNFAP